MFEDYREIVFAAYKRKKEEGLLSSNLHAPSPARLRNQCEITYDENYSLADENILKGFFGAKGDATDYSLRIRNFDIDKFRPLVKFLNGRITYTDDKNIELLSWLINFSPRPYPLWKKNSVISDQISAENSGIEDELLDKQDIKSVVPNEPEGILEKSLKSHQTESGSTYIDKRKIISSRVVSNATKRKLIYAFVASAIVFGSSYFFYNKNNQGCMYWNGNRYQSVGCNIKVSGANVLALDTFQVNHVRKITRPDTITRSSIRKIWYAKINGMPEFFTDSSYHPTDNRKRMLPLTEYMYDKYIEPQKHK
ncbi:hypothetical protein [Pedobacter duraquae]|uniref:Transmembrane protein n=1 Tax=Pedobacter duraquae TaxID=425511 RepID=A0A4R6IR51_9SPHI|nr:hypothetical protein [Pedobacter duraquae]TDO24859.1 hypothetical protein CLV32_1153 [Pedobacter duraquae]